MRRSSLVSKITSPALKSRAAKTPRPWIGDGLTITSLKLRSVVRIMPPGNGFLLIGAGTLLRGRDSRSRPAPRQIPSRRNGLPQSSVAGAQNDTRVRSGVALLFPRIAADVVTVLLPEARAVLRDELEATQPLGALPEVDVRHDQAAGAAVLGRQLLTTVLVGEEDVVAPQVAEEDVRRVTAVAVRDHRRRVRPRLDMLHQL